MRYTDQQVARALARVDLGMRPKDAAKTEGIKQTTFSVYNSHVQRAKRAKDIAIAVAALKAAGIEKATAITVRPPTVKANAADGDEVARLKNENAMLKRMLAEYWAKEES